MLNKGGLLFCVVMTLGEFSRACRNRAQMVVFPASNNILISPLGGSFGP
jgi:hypothetical protein